MRATPIPDHVLLPRSRWREMGVSTRRLAGDEFVSPLPGLLTPRSAPASFLAVAASLQEVVLPGAVLSHTTAAVLYGLPLPPWVDGGVGLLVSLRDPRDGRHRLSLFSRIDDPNSPPTTGAPADLRGAPLTLRLPHLHCRVPPAVRAGAGPRVSVHRMQPGATSIWQGLTLSAPAEMLLELAVVLEQDDMVVALDHVLGPTSPWPSATRETLSAALGPFRGRPGFRAATRALDDARSGVESPGETRTRLLLRRAGFPEPTPNTRVLDPHLGITRRIDLAYPTVLIGIEYDGDVHRSRSAWRADHARRDSLESLGWTLRRLTADDLRRPARFLSALRRTVLAAGAPAPPESNWLGPAGRELWRPRPASGTDPRERRGR